MLLRQPALCSLVLLGLLLPVGAGLPSIAASTAIVVPGEVETSGDDTRELALARALDAVRPDFLRADLTFLASDEMRGRDTPSPELEIAAQFLASRLMRLGVPPGAEDGYLYPYQLRQVALDAENSRASLALAGGGGPAELLVFGRDYFLRGLQDLASHTLEGPVVWAGSATGPELEAMDLDGAWVVYTDEGAGLGRRLMGVRRAGAKGLLVVPASDDPAQQPEVRFGNVAERLAAGRVRYPSERGQTQREVFPVLMLTQAAGERLVALARPSDAEADWHPEDGTRLPVTFREQRQLGSDDELITVHNVCGFWAGKHSELASEVIVLSAHYDHVGAQGDTVWNGADDNGSGTVGLLAIAEALTAYGPLDRSVLLMWVSGEEKGLYGSRAWAERPWLPEGHRAVANINIDMIGRNDPDQLLLTPTAARAEQYNNIIRTVEALAPLEGFTRLGSADQYYHRSDQASFAQLGIPVAFLFTDVHDDYHQPTDTVEKIDFDKLSRVVRLVLRTLDRLQDQPLQ